MRHCYIGIDIGTSSCKVAAVDEEGQLICSTVSNYPVIQLQSGWNEQEPENWWIGTCDALSKLMHKLDGYTPMGVSFSGQMHSMVALDKDGSVVRPAILWNDQRTEKQCEQIIRLAGGSEKLLSQTNNTMVTGYTGSKILWMKENEPQNYEKTVKVITPKDYIRYRLTNNIATDVSDASGSGLFNVADSKWAKELIEQVGIDRNFFADALESTALAGYVTEEAAQKTNLPVGTPVYAGGGDAVISTLGMGITDARRIGVTLGTSGVVATLFDEMPYNKNAMLQIFRGNIEKKWVSFGCTLSAAGSLQWLHDTFFPQVSFQQLGDEAALVSAEEMNLIFLPYLNGERCPHFDANAKGAFVGVDMMSDRAGFVRAVMEGVAFSQKQVYDLVVSGMKSLEREIIVAGGGAKSPIWKQILADTFKMPVKTVSGSKEGGAYAAALLAMVGEGRFANVEEAAGCISVDSVTEPNVMDYTPIQRRYEKYKKMYEAIKWSFTED